MGLYENIGTFTAIAVIFAIWKSLFSYKSIARLPPGPKGLPIIGNLLDLPAAGTQEWQHWLKHKDLYGPLSSITIFGTTMVIINDRQLALEILEKRAAKHSSRPRLVFADELSGWSESPVSQNNNSQLRAYRKAMARVIGTRTAASKFDGMLEVETRRFLWRVLQRPQVFLQHTRTAAGAFVLKITYDYNIEPHHDDPLVNLADLALQQFSSATVPGAWLVDVIPALKYVPDWVPGAGFKKTARYNVETLTKLVDDPFKYTKFQMSRDDYQHSFASKLIEDGEDEKIAKWASVALYAAGADTTVSALQGFYLAMMLYPDVQRKAQAEIDCVLGERTLPAVADRAKLPYINAMVKESLRWHTVAPLGVPHKTDQDDIVNGHLIPKGAVLLPNIWAYNHDPELYDDPSEFRPERFLSEEIDSASDPHNVTFGFGRRICPGRLIADTSIFLTIVHTLAVFDLGIPRGPDGKEVEPIVAFTPGIISHPEVYNCVLTPRTPGHRDLILEFVRNHPFEESDAANLAEALKQK
ncbi:hypothetical protein N7475_003004 [Penicillium sp. IBT 31633x]|nr:hypothetical protein N7475_003004 [Penicillium sp. IBT 31633x]